MNTPKVDRQRLRQKCAFAPWLMWVALVAPIFCGATTVTPPEFVTLVNDSDYIVHAVVKSVHAEKRPAVRGVKIFTLVELEVIEVVAGKPPASIVLVLLGGKV